MAKECPQCRTMAKDIADHCVSCGYLFLEERSQPRFEAIIASYLAVFTVAMVVASLIVNLRHC